MDFASILQPYLLPGLALGVVYLQGKAWLERYAADRDARLVKRIHEGVVAALNNGGAEPVRRLIREEVGTIIRDHEKVEDQRLGGFAERLAALEAKGEPKRKR